MLIQNILTKKQVGGEKVCPTDTSTALFTIEESENRNSNRAGTGAETVPEHEREDGVAGRAYGSASLQNPGLPARG